MTIVTLVSGRRNAYPAAGNADAPRPRITFHEPRHTFGTRMAASGVPLPTIRHWMGHADAKTTQVCAHYQPSDAAAETVDAAFG